MSGLSKFQTSFAAGELAPNLYARVDLQKYPVGAALLRNFFVDYRGGATTRAGTQYIATANALACRLIPFTVATVDAYVIEMGANYLRFYQNGGLVLSGSSPLVISTPYSSGDFPLVKYGQSADVMTFTHPNYPVYDLTLTSPGVFSFAPEGFGPSIGAPSNLSGVNLHGTNTDTLYTYQVTAVNTQGEESLPSNYTAVGGQLLSDTSGIYNTLTWSAPSGNPAVAYYKIYKGGPTNSATVTANATPAANLLGYIGQSYGTTFTDNDIAPDFTKSPPQYQLPFTPGQIASVEVTSAGSGYNPSTYFKSLTFTGDGNGASGLAIIDPHNANVVGVILIQPGQSYTSCSVSDGGNATYAVTLGPATGTYPSCVSYFQQRRAFGGTINNPESLVFSQTGSYLNFNTSPTILASDAITVSLASSQVNSIKSMVSMPTGLIVFTSGSAFLLSGGGQGTAISPSTIVALPQASSGANDLPPLVINYDVLYCQNRGFVVRDLAFNFYVQSYSGSDRSVLASHLFTNYTPVDWTWAEEPNRTVLVTRSDGTLLVLTYVPEQEVYAWSHYDTNGEFISVCSIPEGSQNTVYVAVQRKIGGTLTTFIERFVSRNFTDLQNSWCLDAGLQLPETYPAANVTLSAATGTTVNAIASSAIFTSGDVGKVLRGNGGQATVVSYTSTTQVVLDIIIPFSVYANDPNNTPLQLQSGNWTYDTPVISVSGLSYLDGMYVSALADGVPVPAQLVTAGTLVLPQPATKVIVGLGYQCQLQTLRIDTGEPTTASKRKTIPAATVRLVNTLGLKMGQNFSDLVEFPQQSVPFSEPNSWYTGDIRLILYSDWTTLGQVCIQQDYPLPASVLGIIPEVTIGDTGR